MLSMPVESVSLASAAAWELPEGVPWVRCRKGAPLAQLLCLQGFSYAVLGPCASLASERELGCTASPNAHLWDLVFTSLRGRRVHLGKYVLGLFPGKTHQERWEK